MGRVPGVLFVRNLWVVGSNCNEDTCTKVTRFDPAASSSFRRSDPPVHLEITFGTGKISGVTGVDDFTVGPFVVRNQSFGLVESEGGHNFHGNIFKVSRGGGGGVQTGRQTRREQTGSW